MEKKIFKLIKVRFYGNPKPHTFIVPEGLEKLRHNDLVIADSDMGRAVGMVNSFIFEKIVSEDCYQKVIRLADEQDLQKNKQAQSKAQELKLLCRDEVEKLGLEMSISHLMPIDFGKKMVVYFTAPNRVDFRELLIQLKRLPHKFELRQIEQQQKMEALGTLGSCGHTTSDYLISLKKYEKRNFSVKKSFSRVS